MTCTFPADFQGRIGSPYPEPNLTPMHPHHPQPHHPPPPGPVGPPPPPPLTACGPPPMSPPPNYTTMTPYQSYLGDLYCSSDMGYYDPYYPKGAELSSCRYGCSNFPRYINSVFFCFFCLSFNLFSSFFGLVFNFMVCSIGINIKIGLLKITC